MDCHKMVRRALNGPALLHLPKRLSLEKHVANHGCMQDPHGGVPPRVAGAGGGGQARRAAAVAAAAA